jgi:hypothetical protein
LKPGRKSGLLLVALAVAMSPVACSGSTGKATPKPTTTTLPPGRATPSAVRPSAAVSGTLTGSARPCFGAAISPAQIAALNVALTVDVANNRGQRVARRVLHARGQAAYRGPLPFSLSLPVGRYTVSSPTNGSQTVQITAGKTSRVALVSHCV